MTRSNKAVYGAVLKVKDFFLSCMELYTINNMHNELIS